MSCLQKWGGHYKVQLSEEQGMCLESKLKAKESKPQIQQSFHFPFGNQEETKKCHHPVKVLWTWATSGPPCNLILTRIIPHIVLIGATWSSSDLWGFEFLAMKNLSPVVLYSYPGCCPQVIKTKCHNENSPKTPGCTSSHLPDARASGLEIIRKRLAHSQVSEDNN